MGSGSNLTAIQSSVARMSVRSSPGPEDAKQQEVGGASSCSAMPDQGAVLGVENGMVVAPDATQSMPGGIGISGDRVGSSVQDTTAHLPSPATSSQLKSPDDSLSPPNNRSRSGSTSSVVSHGSGMSQGSPHHHQAQLGGISVTNLPPSLADLQSPSTFKLDTTPPTKRKITKASFYSQDTSMQDNTNDPTDPLSQLDPLWTIKPNQRP